MLLFCFGCTTAKNNHCCYMQSRSHHSATEHWPPLQIVIPPQRLTEEDRLNEQSKRRPDSHHSATECCPPLQTRLYMRSTIRNRTSECTWLLSPASLPFSVNPACCMYCAAVWSCFAPCVMARAHASDGQHLMLPPSDPVQTSPVRGRNKRLLSCKPERLDL
jgi:hypothetical protein